MLQLWYFLSDLCDTEGVKAFLWRQTCFGFTADWEMMHCDGKKIHPMIFQVFFKESENF